MPGKYYLVETDKIEHNIKLLCSAMGIGRVYAVVKANGYGLGCGEMVRLCSQFGVRCFAVSDITGARVVRSTGVPVEELLLLSSADPDEIPELVELGVTFTVASRTDAQRLECYNTSAHIKVDTGLGRRGLTSDATDDILALYRDFPNLCYTGIYTHFSDPGHALRQFRRFSRVLHRLERAGIDPGVRHCCSSSTVFRWREMHLDGIRVGSALLGRVPGGEAYGLQRTGVCRVPIESIRMLKRGSTVGYGSMFRTHRKTTVALCAVGTHNGFGVRFGYGRINCLARLYQKLFRDGDSVLFGKLHGTRCAVLGHVSTEGVVLDVTDVLCREGDLMEFEVNPLLLHDVPVVFCKSE